MSDKPDTELSQRKEAFGLRLKIAALSRYRTVTRFLEQVRERQPISPAGFYKHWAGNAMPREDIIALYAALLGLDPRWLRAGDGESIEALRDAADALDRGVQDHPDLVAILKQISASAPERDGINHGLQQFGADYGKPSAIRHIPILSGEALAQFVSGNGGVAQMALEFVPVLTQQGIGPRAVGYRIPPGDISMVSSADAASFPPGTSLVIDPDRPIHPGDYLLVRPRGEEAWMLRRYKAALPHGRARQFTLEAINPSFEPIRVTDPAKWDVAGRAVMVLRDL